MHNSTAIHKISCPRILADIPDPPKELYVIGDSLEVLLTKPRLAIVGSRKVSPYGKAVTQKIAKDCAEQGIVIVSGLAYGVDSLAQRAALEAGGQVIAVLAGGLDEIYPKTHADLARLIVEKGGVLISELPRGQLARQWHFLQRNRLISGLSDGVLITEAAERSGTLNTAAHALNQSKPVMAVPGNIDSPMSAGTNMLIKQGGHLVSFPEDVFDVLGIEATAKQAAPRGDTEQEQAILDLIFSGARNGSVLQENSRLSTVVFNQTMSMLEVSGKIKPLGGNQWTI